MSPDEHLRAGNLKEAVQELNEQVRRNPLDPKLRTFLFELLCFAGEYDRCGKQLEVLAQAGNEPAIGTLLYQAALRAEKERQRFFAEKEYQSRPEANPSASGVCNGRTFYGICDQDPRIGARLEVFAAGSYMWIPFEHIAKVTIQPPARLRDLIWIPAQVHAADSFQGRDLGNVLLPALSPGSWRHPDDLVRLGRATVWETLEDGSEVPFGQKMLVVDEEEVPILELRNLVLGVAAVAQ
jgi:type VI secretion system protein ImpE